MAYSHVEMKAFSGLYLQPNSFAVPDGGLEVAQNCVITNDATIAKRRGQYTFHTPSGGTLNNLFVYQSNLLALFNSKIDRISSGGVSTTLGGVAVALSGGRVGRSVEQNSNFYFTSDNGVMKLTSYTADVQKAGIPAALDLTGELFVGSTNFFSNNNQVAYRIVFGLRDANKNLLLGAPSDFLFLVNNSGGARAVRLEFTIPNDLTSAYSYFYQVYRTSLSGAAATDPDIDFKLIDEQDINFSALVATNRRVIYEDYVADSARAEGAELYTNPNSREGELQANATPPLCTDMALYKGYTLYAGVTERHQLTATLVSTAGLASGDYIELTQDGGATSRRYVARAGLGNESASATCAGTTTITITYASHGFSNGDQVYVYGATGGSPNITEALYSISGVTANTFTITANTGANSTACYIQGVRDSSNNYIFTMDNVSVSVTTQIDRTSYGLVKAINRDQSAPVYAKYLSSQTDTPGSILLESETFSGVAIQLRASTTTVGNAFIPALPTTYGTVVSEQFSQSNVILFSKFGIPEAAPVVNQVEVGSRNKAILRIFALRDSVIVLKEDGVFRIDGDTIGNFQATIIDNTVFCNAPSSAALLNNLVHFLSNQGVCVASSTSVEILSRNVELPIAAVLGQSTLSAQTAGIGYESERLYILTTLAPRQTVASECYVYNTLTRAWTTWDTYFTQGVVGPGDRLYTIASNVIKKERKDQNRLDYCDESYSATATTVSSNKLSATIASGSTSVDQGDVVYKGSVVNRVKSSTLTSPGVYSVVFEFATDLNSADAVTIYKKYTSTIKHAPFHAGQTNREKHYAQFQVHTRDPSFTYAEIYFITDIAYSSEVTTWRSSTIEGGQGWGNLPWGFFPWGLGNGINLTYDTQPATIVRILVPLEATRSSWIQAVIEHKMAGEPMNIQALGYQLRGYGERVSR